MNVLEASQHLIQERLNVFGCKILWRHDELVKIRIDICEKRTTTTTTTINALVSDETGLLWHGMRRMTHCLELTFKNEI
jgi:ligand-binding sensor domain-containing protein